MFTENFEISAGAIFQAMGIAPPAISSNLAHEGVADVFDIDASQHACDIELYQRAWDRYRTVSPDQASAERSAALGRFKSTPFDQNALREFIWEAAFLEFDEWGILPEIIKKKRKRLEELKSEINYYESRLKSSRNFRRLFSRLMNWQRSPKLTSALPTQRTDLALKGIRH